MYYVDIGYNFANDKSEVLNFANLSDAKNFVEEVRRVTGEILSIEK